ncbi:hypothetical protein A3J41_03505 [candidate division TM6 bacterium RIFCSPHIGHO2_12_FULL_38_8]|nr:MAG: hypothetical protein A3J41_03505 [candidate division TM6 bacterium RIFCSPHIGHO2_12_FULL_38_8]
MKKFLIPALLVAFSAGSVSAFVPSCVSNFCSKLPGSSYAKDGAVYVAGKEAALEKYASDHIKTTVLVTVIATLAAKYALDCYAAAQAEDESGF